VTKYLFFEISDSYDWIFHNRFQGSVNLSVPFGGHYCYPNKKKQTCHNIMDWQAVLPVERQEIIVVTKFKKKQIIDPVAIDPTTGKPFYVVFVDNTNTRLGNGTFENPFQNLSTADNATSAQSGSFPDNTIYVFAGNGTSLHMLGGNMGLQANQRLLGSGNAHQYQTTKGLLTIPALTSNAPQVAGTGNNVIVLNNNNEVSGFNITVPATFAGIRSGVITGANINFNNITAGSFAIALGQSPATLVSGTIIANNNIANLQANGNPTIYQFFISNANLEFTNNLGQNLSDTSTTGLLASMQATSGTSTVLVENNTFNTITGTTSAIGIQVSNLSTGGGLTATVNNNTVDITKKGLDLSTISPVPSTFIVTGNTLINATQTSAVTTSGSGVACVRFNYNTGYPSLVGSPFAITGSGASLSYEPLINNYPSFVPTGTVTPIAACTCAPCP
jgi:hypothetical protein